MKTVFRKSVAIMLAALILVSAGIAGITASANSAEVAGTLGFETKFFRYDADSDEWIETDRAKKGETLKARVYVDTDYFTNSGELLFFYDKDFFADNYEKNEINVATVNPYYEQACDMEGQIVVYGEDHSAIQKMVDNGTITADFAREHTGIAVLYSFGIRSTNMKLSGEEWLIEFELTVREDTQAESGDFFAVETTVQSPDNEYGFINVPVGKEGEYLEDAEILFGVYVDVNVNKNPVSAKGNIVLDANGGYFSDFDNADEITVQAEIGTEYFPDNAQLPHRENFVFAGWLSETGDMITPENPVEIGYEDIVLIAMWEEAESEKYSLTLNANGGIFDNGNERIEYELEAGEVIELSYKVQKEGYNFAGWMDENGEFVSRFVMPEQDAVLTAVWEAEEYTVTFNTDGGNEIQPLTLTFGEEFTLPTAKKTGHSLAFWRDESGNIYVAGQKVVMPAKDKEFKAVWLVQSNSVTYIIGKNTVKFDVVPGNEVPRPDMSAYENIEFLCWLDANGNEVQLPSVMPENNLTFTAKLRYICDGNQYGVTASYENGCFDYEGDDLDFAVEKANGNREPGGVYFKGENYKQLAFYNIRFCHGSTTVQPKTGNTVQISIPVPASYKDGTKFLVINRFVGGGYEQISITKNGDMLVLNLRELGEFEICVESGTTVKTAPSKTSYAYKESLDLSGLTLEVLDENGNKTVVDDTSKMTVKGYDPKKIGKQTLTVEYVGTSTQFDVTVAYTWWQMLIRILFLGFLWY